MSVHNRGSLLAALAGFLALAGAPSPGHAAAAPAQSQSARCAQSASAVQIVRDDWGIAHVHGRTDADAVFGMVYAQAEDDFNRIEINYLTALGRLAEAQGDSALYQDLRQRLFVRTPDLQRLYTQSPAWLQKLMNAWADGLNCFLSSHPSVKPRVLAHFEPWMALSFTEGSIGGDIERADLLPLARFYDQSHETAYVPPAIDREPGGSNGIALAPGNTLTHHALLLINPHTSFFFRSELQMSSDEGLNVYGAVTWGQFFIYQGFNERVGWMHTSSGVDNVDFFAESIVNHDGHLFYRYGKRLRPVTVSRIEIASRGEGGSLGHRSFTTYATHHGPIIAERDGHWIAIALMQKPIEALEQSFLLTRARDYAGYMQVMQLRANSSNNTILADADGDIAYLHPQFVPRRNDRFDYTRPVDGADPSTDWHGLHTLQELPQVLNPPNGWVMNTNDWPYSAAGESSPKREQFARYMDTAGENPRGIHAMRLLKDRHDFTADALNAAAYDSYLPAFADLLPTLIAAWDNLAVTHPLKGRLADPIDVLRHYDYRWGVHSVATTLAALWGDELWALARSDADAENLSVYASMAEHTSAEQKLSVLASVIERLQHDFGTWRVPWGEINRCQRLTGDIRQNFSDAAPSLPVAFTSARWGSLASFGARRYEGTNRYYGTSGNSFVAIVEFGARVSARAISMGGESGDPASPHFNDQAARYADGSLREVYFYPDQLEHHTERRYQPQ
jgi:acyl-homoserine-lactone acylase